jgi:hypothetical protein
MRYTVEVSKVDEGSQTVGYNSRKDAIASAGLAAFSLGSHDDLLKVKESFENIKRREYASVTFEPSLKQWAITIRKHRPVR